MAYDGLGMTDITYDSISLQLREAEYRRSEAERAHQVKYITLHYRYIYYIYIKQLSGDVFAFSKQRCIMNPPPPTAFRFVLLC